MNAMLGGDEFVDLLDFLPDEAEVEGIWRDSPLHVLDVPEKLDEREESRTISPETHHEVLRRKDCLPATLGEATHKKSVHRKGGRKKKSKDAPKRPLSAYNLFFRQERQRIQKESNQKTSFNNLGKIIGERWRNIDPNEKKKFEEESQKESLRYQRELQAFTQLMKSPKSQSPAEISPKMDPAFVSSQDVSEQLTRETQGVLTHMKQLSSSSCTLVSREGAFEPPTKTEQPKTSETFQSDKPKRLRLPRNNTQVNGGQVRSSAAENDQASAGFAAQDKDTGKPVANRTVNGIPCSAVREACSRSGINTVQSLYQYPEGSEVFIRDPNGRFRKFRVEYQAYRMSTRDAKVYMAQLRNASPLYPPPPPRGAFPL